MRFSTIALVAALGAASLWPAGVRASGPCSYFDDCTVDGWTAQAATVEVGTSGGIGGSCYLRCGDLPSPPISAIIAPASYYQVDWSLASGVCFCFKLDDDGWSSYTQPVSNLLYISNSTVTDGIRAVFILNTAINEGDGWHCYTAPLHTISSGDPLPSNGDGHWGFTGGSGSTWEDWNNLITNVNVAFFPGDIGGSPSQTEDFGVDNFCLGCIEVGTEPTTWGTLKALYR